jgi:RNA polymerase sigma factor (sigma-70 family)
MIDQAISVESDPSSAPDPRVDAWDRFYAHCFRIINQCPFVRRLDSTDREDCAQEVMMEVVRKLGERRPDVVDESLTGWIRVVSRNKAVNITRRKGRNREVLFDDGTGAGILDRPAEASAGLPESDSLSLLWEALATLDEEVTMSSYVIFYLRTIENWAVPDIAKVFQITPEQTRFRCHRVRKRFASILKAKQPTDDESTEWAGSDLEPNETCE